MFLNGGANNKSGVLKDREVKMQKDFLKRKIYHTVALILFLYTFSISCTQKSFLCWNEQKTEAMAFAFDETSVTVRDIHRYSTVNSSKEPLQSHMPGGTHRLQMNLDSIILEVIQDTASAKIQLPSGKFTNSHTEFENEEEYLKQKRYHAVYPVIHKYIFDKKLSKLSLLYSRLSKPRSAIAQKYIYNKTADEYFLEKIKDLTDEEFSTIFPAHEKSQTYMYPNCEEESHSMKQMIRSILRHLTFP